MSYTWVEIEKRMIGDLETIELVRWFNNNDHMDSSVTNTTIESVKANNELDTCNGTMYAYIRTNDGWPITLNRVGGFAEVEVTYSC